MPQVAFDAAELQGAKVNFVSLVKRGANRIPFRITKEDEPMLDLGNLRRRIFNKADPTPEIVAVIAGEQANLTAATEVLKAEGLYAAGEPAVKDGLHIVAKSDQPDGAALSMPGDVAVVVSHIAKDFGFASTGVAPGFEERLIVSGFSISACMATDLLSDAVVTALATANSPADAAQELTAVIDVYRTYVLSLVGALPSAVSKADAALYKAAKAPKKPSGQASGDKEPDGDEGAGDKMKKGEEISANPTFGNDTQSGAISTGDGNIEGNPAYGNETKKAKQKTPMGGADNDIEGSNQDTKNRVASGGSPVEKAESDQDVGKKAKGNKLPEDKSGAGAEEGSDQTKATVKKGDLDALMTLMTEFQKSVTEQLGGIKTDFSTLSGRVDAVAGQVQKAETALRGTVLGEAGSDLERRAVRKTDGSDIPLLDTAFDRRAVAS